jgi:hypothetical protein
MVSKIYFPRGTEEFVVALVIHFYTVPPRRFQGTVWNPLIRKFPAVVMTRYQNHLFAAILLLFIALGGMFVWRLQEFRSAVAEIRLHPEDFRLRERIRDLSRKVDSLQSAEKELRALVDLSEIPEDILKMGTGGALEIDADSLLGDLTRVEKELDRLHNSFREVASFAQSLRSDWEHLPSIRPVEGGYVSSGFGRRIDPFTGMRSFHRGMDFKVPRGTPVKATAAGRVVLAKRLPGYGRTVQINHGNGLLTAYAHLSVIKVRYGQKVKRGDIIGLVGNTGRSTSAHLHYEVRENGGAVNPYYYIVDNLYVSD